MIAHFLFANKSSRKKILSIKKTEQESYSLYGLDELLDYGIQTTSNLNDGINLIKKKWILNIVNRTINLIIPAGDWLEVIGEINEMNKSDVIFSTSDRVGVPLCILKKWGYIKKPILYLSVGLIERLNGLKKYQKRYIIDAVNKSCKIICFGYEEYVELENIFPNKVEFLRLGMKEFYKTTNDKNGVIIYDIISVGNDINRDYSILINYAIETPNVNIKIITSNNKIKEIKKNFVPKNVTLSTPMPFSVVVEEMLSSKIVVLPLKDNTYSGATTTLLLALSLGKPTIVAETGAIRESYHLKNGENILFYKPNNYFDLKQKIDLLTQNQELFNKISDNCQKTFKQYFNWQDFIKKISTVLKNCKYTDNNN